MAQTNNPTVDAKVASMTAGRGPAQYGFNIRGDHQRLLLSLSYATQQEAENARKLIEQAIANATSVVSHA